MKHLAGNGVLGDSDVVCAPLAVFYAHSFENSETKKAYRFQIGYNNYQAARWFFMVKDILEAAPVLPGAPLAR